MRKDLRRPYDIAETAERLNVTEYQVRQAFKRGQLDGFVIGKTIRIRPECVDRLRHGEKSGGLIIKEKGPIG
jgi:hypothetical protein